VSNQKWGLNTAVTNTGSTAFQHKVNETSKENTASAFRDLSFIPWRWKQKFPPKRQAVGSIVHAVVSYRTAKLFDASPLLTRIVLLYVQHDGVISVNNQLDVQFFFMYVYFYSPHVSDSHVPIIRRINCINTTSGICHSVYMTVWYAGANLHTKQPISECWEGSQDSKLIIHASHVALPT
jgi:hypothetical protein